MSWAPLEKLKFETSLEDQFWKQKTWESLKNETNVETLRQAIQLLLEVVVTKQTTIKSLVNFNIEQDMKHMQSDPNPSDYTDFIESITAEK
jgi:hypothetical protein